MQMAVLQELRVLNYTINGTLVALTLFAALSNVIKPNDLPAVPDFFGGIVLASHKLWDAYSFNVDTHPLMTKVQAFVQLDSAISWHCTEACMRCENVELDMLDT